MNRNRILSLLAAYAKIVFGAAIYAAGFQFFLYPHSIPLGGIGGIAMILNFLFQLPIGTMTIIMNIPLFLYAWRRFGTYFMVASLVGMFVSSSLVDLFSVLSISITNQPLLACVYGGLIKGFGMGLVYSAGATAGGVDIIAKDLRRRHPYINFGTIILIMEFVVILAFALISGKYDSSMYAVITTFISGKVVDLVLYGAANSKLCYIITDNSSLIKDAIVEQMRRGVTLLNGEGAYSGKEKKVILCVIKQQQIVQLRKLVHALDENAFVVVTESHEVFGKGFANIADFDQ